MINCVPLWIPLPKSKVGCPNPLCLLGVCRFCLYSTLVSLCLYWEKSIFDIFVFFSLFLIFKVAKWNIKGKPAPPLGLEHPTLYNKSGMQSGIVEYLEY